MSKMSKKNPKHVAARLRRFKKGVKINWHGGRKSRKFCKMHRTDSMKVE